MVEPLVQAGWQAYADALADCVAPMLAMVYLNAEQVNHDTGRVARDPKTTPDLDVGGKARVVPTSRRS